MTPHLNPIKTGLTLGVFVGGMHVLWSLFILLGWKKPLIEFSQWAHMIAVPFVVQPFDITAALTVVVMATGIGFVVGNVLAHLFNWAHRA